jgi:hypothetical protein
MPQRDPCPRKYKILIASPPNREHIDHKLAIVVLDPAVRTTRDQSQQNAHASYQ